MNNLQFVPVEFLKNLVYMGVGMLGVFMIVAIIMGATYLTSYLTEKFSKNSDGE